MGFVPRLSTAGMENNPKYYSDNPFYLAGYGLPNCTCYAWGRAYEILGSKPNLSTGNAITFYDYNKTNNVYSYGNTPKLGAIAVFNGSGPAGHVAVVEMIVGNTVTISQSAYGGTYFYTENFDYTNTSAVHGGLIGFIYIPCDTTIDTAINPPSLINDNSMPITGSSEEYIQSVVDTDTAEIQFTVTQETNEYDFSKYTNYDTFYSGLSDVLRVNDLRGILGMPYQFLPTTDPRIDGSMDDDVFGTEYAQKIIVPIPLLLMTPGTPTFMASYNKKERSNVLTALIAGMKDVLGDEVENSLSDLFNSKSGKYYSLKYDYTHYFYYVNAMLRSAAYFLGIENTKINGTSLKTYNWYNETVSSNNLFGNEGLDKFLSCYKGAIPIYADSDTSISDSFSNSTTTSSLSGLADGLSDKGREMNFILNNVGGIVGLQADTMGNDALSSNLGSVSNLIENALGSGNIISEISNNARTLLAGGRMMFPEIWSDSTFSRDYSIKMKLASPSGDKLSIYLNIFVPIYFILGFVWPRASSAQSYFSPFLVRAFYKGLFNVDMGIITGFSINKGAEGEWTVDGLPTVVDLSFDIKDLYDGIFMSSGADKGTRSLFSNVTELDYIANSCGININEPELGRTLMMHLFLGGIDKIKDKVTIGIFGGISQYFSNKINSIFGVFK